MIGAIVVPLAKLGIGKLLDGDFGKVANIIIFQGLFGKQKDDGIERALLKLDTLLEGQEQIKDLIRSLPAKIALKTSLDEMINITHGLALAIKSGKPNEHEIGAMRKFLALTGTDSCRGLADGITQKLFGTGNLTPAGFWIEDGAKGAKGAIHSDSYVATHLYDLMRSVPDGSLEITAYIERVMELFKEIMGWYACLAATYILVDEFLRKSGLVGDEEGRGSNPLLRTAPGLGGMAADFVTEHLIRSSEAAFRVYYHVFVEGRPLKLAIVTNYLPRVFECDEGPGRRVLKMGSGGYSGVNYRINKIVFAQYEEKALDKGNSGHWWEVRRMPRASMPNACAFRSARGNRYLGVYTYNSHKVRGGKQGDGYRESLEVGMGSSPDDYRAWWSIHVRRDTREGGVTFNLWNGSQGAALCVTHLPQSEVRQVFFWGTPDANDHKTFRFAFPD